MIKPSPVLRRKVKCKMCGSTDERRWVYKFWHFVTCFESLGPIVWTKTWWVCNSCYPNGTVHDRFHEIDGHQYSLTTRPPFIRK